MVLYFSNSFTSSIRKDTNLLLLFLSPSLTLNILTHPRILGNVKTNFLIILSTYAIEYLESVFDSINFDITILSMLASQMFIGFF